MTAAADYYTAESEDGDVVCDPSEDALYIMVSHLRLPPNSFLTIEPPNPDVGWYVVVALQDGGGYEVEYRDARRREHRIEQEEDRSRLCREVTTWLNNAVSYNH